MTTIISFVLDNHIVDIDFNSDRRYVPTTTVLNYLRSLPGHKGTKEGCAEGDCGACTVVLAELNSKRQLVYRAVDSCLLLLPMLHGKQLITVENLKSPAGILHPVQQAMVDTAGSQCGFCTPGIVMSLFALYKSVDQPNRDQIEEYLGGNLCRCTGYQPIIAAAEKSCGQKTDDHFKKSEAETDILLRKMARPTFALEREGRSYYRPQSTKEALHFRRHHPQALVINGATDVALRLTKNFEDLTDVLDLSAVSDLNYIHQNDHTTTIGSGTSLSKLRNFSVQGFPALNGLLAVFGSLQIRNMATIGGNLSSASPIGDLTPYLMACKADIVLESEEGIRTVSVMDFITGYRATDCKPNELVTGIVIPFVREPKHLRFYKISKRLDLDISTVSGGFLLHTGDDNIVKSIILAFGGMAAQTKCAEKTEHFFNGKEWTRENVYAALPLLDQDFSPITDARSGANGRRQAAQNLLIKFWSETAG
ncbi:MAG: xanthine dehydrogenase small subunit [Calditrichales bacterium]|nr:MAG: xanthine dehydrogenase small subunit [Calditrichales bacterium]